MTSILEDANIGRVASLRMVRMADATTPPMSPAPMPRQTLVYWTPRLALFSAVRTAKELRRRQLAPPALTQPVAIPVPNSDESR